MFNNKTTDVVVVGAGPVGMLSALILNRHDIDVIIIDKAERTSTRSNATLLYPSTLKLMDRWGLLEQIMDTAYRIDSLEIYDDRQLKAKLHYTNLDTEYPFLASIPQAILEGILERVLESKGIPILWNHKAVECVEGDHEVKFEVQRFSDQSIGYAVSRMEKMIDKQLTIKGRYAIAADGYRSLMRKRLQMRKLQGDTPEFFALFDFSTDSDLKHCLRISLDHGLITAQTPIAPGFSRLGFQYKGLDLPNYFRSKSRSVIQRSHEFDDQFDDVHLRDLIANRMPWDPGYIERVAWRKAVPFERYFVEKILVHKTILLGDAARSFEPVSAASLNLGLHEAATVATALGTSLYDQNLGERIQELGDRFLMEWQLRHHPENHCDTEPDIDTWLALNQRHILPCIPAAGDELEQLVRQLSIRLHSPHPVHF